MKKMLGENKIFKVMVTDDSGNIYQTRLLIFDEKKTEMQIY